MKVKEFIDFIRENNLDNNTEVIVRKRFLDRNTYETFEEIVPSYLNVENNKLLIQIGDY
jgi:hypothetical protein